MADFERGFQMQSSCLFWKVRLERSPRERCLGKKNVVLRRAWSPEEERQGKREGGIHSWGTRIPMPVSRSLFRGDLSHTTVNATEQTDGMGLQCNYETEGRARLKEGGFLGPEDQSVSVCERVCVRERERERESVHPLWAPVPLRHPLEMSSRGQ